jgi:hypothetical protein
LGIIGSLQRQNFCSREVVPAGVYWAVLSASKEIVSVQAVLSASKEAISVQAVQQPTEAEILRPYSSQQRENFSRPYNRDCWAIQQRKRPRFAGPYSWV